MNKDINKKSQLITDHIKIVMRSSEVILSFIIKNKYKSIDKKKPEYANIFVLCIEPSIYLFTSNI